MRVALVSEEYPPHGGGIATAYAELASFLARRGHEVHVFVPAGRLQEEHSAANGIHVRPVDTARYSWRSDAAARSWSFMQALRENASFDAIHFHDYLGSAFFSIKAKRQGFAFGQTSLVVQVHGPSLWAQELNGALPHDDEHLKIQHMERYSIENADHVIAPSQYILQWMIEKGWSVAHSEVIPNLRSDLSYSWSNRARTASVREDGHLDIVAFGRQEERKGLRKFLAAVERLCERFDITVHICGSFGEIGHVHSGLFLLEWAARLNVKINVLPNLDRFGALEYILGLGNPLIVVPSTAENSPYTVVEPAVTGLPVVFSGNGGARELFAESNLSPYLFDENRDLYATLLELLTGGSKELPEFAHTDEVIEATWEQALLGPTSISTSDPSPERVHQEISVCVAIVHYERPIELWEALQSVFLQSELPQQVVVIDDGSRSAAAKRMLTQAEKLLRRTQLGSVIYQDNKYLGAARNTALSVCKQSHIVFLDDDNLLLPSAISTLKRSAIECGADAVAAMARFLEPSDRAEAVRDPSSFSAPVGFLPLGGPLALALVENVLGDATGIYRTAALREVGGFSELYGVGYEDYELYLRMAAGGMRVEVCPEIVYLYQVGARSMITETSAVANHARVVRAVARCDPSALWPPLLELYAMVAGARSLEIARGRARWLAKGRFGDDIVESLVPWQTSPEMAVRTLEQACDRERLTNISFVLQPQPATPKHVGRPAPARLPRGRPSGPEPDVPEVGQGVDAILAATSAARNDPSRLRELLLSTKEFDRQSSSGSAVRAIRTHIHLLLGEVSQAASIFSPAMDSDERQYLAENPDVAEQVARGVFTSGHHHFQDYGEREGRLGYSYWRRTMALQRVFDSPGLDRLDGGARRKRSRFGTRA